MKPLLLALAFAAPSLHAQILDQEQNSAPICMATFSQPDLAQSFQPGVENVAGAGLFLFAGIGSSSLVTLELWDALPNNGGTLLGSGSATGSPGSWVDVFWSDVPVTIGTTYFLVLKSPGSSMCIGGDASDPYSGGQLYAGSGFGSFPGMDYAFHTWFNDIPHLEVTPPQAGGFMDITVNGLTSGSALVLVMSSLGPGPTNTPFGVIEVTPPFRLSPSFPEIGGSFDWTSTVPIGAAGSTFYMQVVEFEQGGVVELSNALAVLVN